MLLELTGMGYAKVLFDYNLKEWVAVEGHSQSLCLEFTISSGNINFYVNQDWDASVLEGFTEAEKSKVAREGIKMWKKLLKQTPKGTMFYCNAYSDDGKGLKREKLYKRMGFRKVGTELVYLHK